MGWPKLRTISLTQANKVKVSPHAAKPRRAMRFSPLDRKASTSRSAESAAPTPKWKHRSMMLDSLLCTVASSNPSVGERVTNWMLLWWTFSSCFYAKTIRQSWQLGSIDYFLGRHAGWAGISNEIGASAAYRIKGRDYTHEELSWFS